ncbi:MAG: DUF4147 domain-containing protein, partial [Gammaproteobacteria bacterium]|nr:DUF4147 domain-containing protein [Gammaproteobacteria bacterium]
RVKGGRLAQAAFPARTITLAISDVPGDDPSTIASGPTVGDRTTRADAIKILRKYHLELPPAIDTLLASEHSESPHPDDASLSRTEYSVTATPADALRAAASLAQQQGFRITELGDDVEGLAQDIAAEHARRFQDLQHKPTPSPFLMLSGGELTVRVNGKGRGGPNQEYLLALAIALDGRRDTFAIACDTDGIDGASASAGALITPDTLARARSLGMHPQDYLSDNNAGAFFERLGDLVTTGPTCTNVNDFRARAAAVCHVARSVCRRAERRLCSIDDGHPVNPASRRYLNRLSDLLFVMARSLNRAAGTPDVLWQRDFSSPKEPEDSNA